jgi:hypothetical protein
MRFLITDLNRSIALLSLLITTTTLFLGSDQRKWANNIIDDLSKGIKDQPELKNILQPLVDIIKNNKKSSNLGMLVAQYFDSLPDDVKQVLAANQIDIPTLIKNMGFTPDAVHTALNAAWGSAFSLLDQGAKLWEGGSDTTTTKKTDAGTAQGASFATNFVAGVQSQATQIATALDKVITDSAKGWDIIAQLAGIKNAAMFSQGWVSFKEFGSQVFTWVAANIGPIGQSILGLGTGSAAYFSMGWKAFTDLGNTIDSWIAAAQAVTIPTIQGLGAGAAAYFSVGWQKFTTIGSDIATWLTKSVNTSAEAIKAVEFVCNC